MAKKNFQTALAVAGHDELLDRLNGMRDKWFGAMRDKWEIYRDGLCYLYGDQLGNETIKPGWDHIVVNYIFPAVMQELAYQTQRQLTVIARPVEQSDTDASEVWTRHLEWLYRRELKMPMELLRAKLDGAIYGKYILYNYWDPQAEWDEDAERWKGAIRSRLVRPDYVAVDPDAEDPHEGRGIITRRRMSVEEALTRWPEYEEVIQDARGQQDEKWFLPHIGSVSAPYDGDRDELSDERQGDDNGRLANMLHGLLYRHDSGGGGDDGEDTGSDNITLEQYWFRDPEMIERQGKEQIPEEDLLAEGKILHDADGGGFLETETGKPMMMDNWPTRNAGKVKIPRFPRGRFVLRIADTILNPKPDHQVWMFRRWPFAFGYNQILPHVSEGLNATEMARNLQDRVNRAERHVMNQVKFFSDPVQLYEEGAYAGGGGPVNRAGAARKLNKGGLAKTRREEGVDVGSGLVQTINGFKADLRDQTGVQEVGLGRQTGGDQTAREVLALQTNTKLRGAMGNVILDATVVAHFENILDQAQRMYAPGDMIRVAGERDADSVYQITAGEKTARFDVALEVSTTLPYDEDKEQNEALALFEALGPAYAEALLDAFKNEDKEEILEKYQAWQMIQQALAAQKEGGGEAAPAAEPTQQAPQQA